MSIYLWPVVIFVTSLAAFWLGGRVTRPKRVPVGRLADPAPMPGELPRAGRFAPLCPMCGESWGHPHDPRCARLRGFAGAADPAQQLQSFDLMTVLSDGYSRGLAAASQVEVADQMAVLIAEMRAEQWRGEG